MSDENNNEITTMLPREAIIKEYYHGIQLFAPFKRVGVFYKDAESSRSGTKTDSNGIVTHFVCDLCKKEFKADKAHAIRIKVGEFPLLDEEESEIWTDYEKAFCGRCYKKTAKMRNQILKAIWAFDKDFCKGDTK